MPATVEVAESNGLSATRVETVDPANLNLGSNDSAELNPVTYPITAGADKHSYEKWVRLYVSSMGDSSIVDNIKVWLSNLGGGWKTDEGMSTNLRTSGYSAVTYPTAGPVDTDSADADQVMPEAEPGGANIGIGGSLGGQITSSPNYSDWMVFQLDVSGSTPSGALNQKTFTFQWDEQ